MGLRMDPAMDWTNRSDVILGKIPRYIEVFPWKKWSFIAGKTSKNVVDLPMWESKKMRLNITHFFAYLLICYGMCCGNQWIENGLGFKGFNGLWDMLREYQCCRQLGIWHDMPESMDSLGKSRFPVPFWFPIECKPSMIFIGTKPTRIHGRLTNEYRKWGCLGIF